jgi:phytanoyl-CoA hydroxylase
MHEPDLYRGRPYEYAVAGLDGVSDADVERYREEGFLVVRGAFSPEKARAARDELARMTTMSDPQCLSMHFEQAIWQHVGDVQVSSDDGGSMREEDKEQLRHRILALSPQLRGSLVRKFVGYTKEHPPLKALANDPALRRVLARLVEARVKLFVSQAMIKPPGGREKPWHQDHAYFDLPLDTGIVGVWIALDEATPENGCMHVIPGGHRTGPRIHFRVRDWQLCDTDVERDSVVSVPLSAGDLLLFDGKIPHGTPHNGSPTQRWAVQYHYIPKHAQKIDASVRLAAFGSEGKDVYC